MSSSLSVPWLTLREPVDARSRSRVLESIVVRRFGRGSLQAVDLAGGTGASIRHLAARLAPTQRWMLVVANEAQGAAARASLSAWAETARDEEGMLRLTTVGRTLEVQITVGDLGASLEEVVPHGTELVLASALLDRVSAGWLSRLTTLIGARRALALLTLIYDGRAQWSPAHALDAPIGAAYARHLLRDRGFGPALGGTAASATWEAFAAHPQRQNVRSDWRLGAADAPLQQAMVDNWVVAALEDGGVPPDDVDAWQRMRREAIRVSRSHLHVGHHDLVVLPR